MREKNPRIKIVYRKLMRERALGQTDNVTAEIDPRLVGKKKLEIIIHECMHILFPAATEAEVTNKAARLTRTLWHEGYRHTDNHDNAELQDSSR